MNRSRLLCCILIAACWVSREARAQELPPSVTKKIDFATDVRPLLVEHCWSCHGGEKQESGLRLDRKDLALLGGDSGRVLSVGNSSESRLIHYVSGVDAEKMMPPEGDSLTDAQIGILRAWIDQGLEWQSTEDDSQHQNSHWAYQPLRVTSPPTVNDDRWPVNQIDRFVLAELEKRSVTPSPQANRPTLIRRLSLDLLGLLPTVEEVDAFRNDASDDAYESLVDRMLSSPHFGERWGRHWLDMARYADSDGYEKDNPRPDAYRWRDWVIDAINSDMPFDQFTIEQLAGDLIPDASPMQRLATAFHRQTLTNTEGGTDQEQFRVEACFDRTETTGAVWLGLTIGCARCHTHKYDQVTQREYYQLFAVFNNGDEQSVTVPKSAEEIAAYEVAQSEFNAKHVELTAKIKAIQSNNETDFAAWQNALQKELNDASKDPVKLHAIEHTEYTSDADVTFEEQKGRVVLVGGTNPDKVIYTVAGKTSVDQITGLRLDVFPDKSLPSNGPGRVAHGNFVLSEVSMEVASRADFQDARRLEFAIGKADFEQADRPWAASHVFDGNDESGWAIAPQFGKKHWLVLSLKEPLQNAASTYIRIRMSQQYGKQHTIGRFKISLQTGVEANTSLPDNILQALNTSEDNRTTAQSEQLQEYFWRQKSPSKELYVELDALKKKEPEKPELAVRTFEQRTPPPRTTWVLRRGEFLDPIKELQVQPAGLAVLPPMEPRNSDAEADRMDLAQWLVSPLNPLTPRVTVNHVWRHLFGHGLVRTPNDFGVRGDRPTHPELLDWLASEFVKGAGNSSKTYEGIPWSRKAIIKQIVMSATYQQSSRVRSELAESDPQNSWLARQNRIRVEGEILRDISLQAAGLLSNTIGGPSVYPPLPPGIAELSYAGNFKWTESTGDDRYRRGMYTFFKRTSPHPNLITFDCPDANLACIERQLSNTPLQALTSLNNETFAEASRVFARRLLALPDNDDTSRMALAFRICVARDGKASELEELQQLLSESRDWYLANPEQATMLVGKDAAPGIAPHVNAAWIATSRILLNLDEFITRE